MNEATEIENQEVTEGILIQKEEEQDVGAENEEPTQKADQGAVEPEQASVLPFKQDSENHSKATEEQDIQLEQTSADKEDEVLSKPDAATPEPTVDHEEIEIVMAKEEESSSAVDVQPTKDEQRGSSAKKQREKVVEYRVKGSAKPENDNEAPEQKEGEEEQKAEDKGEGARKKNRRKNKQNGRNKQAEGDQEETKIEVLTDNKPAQRQTRAQSKPREERNNQRGRPNTAGATDKKQDKTIEQKKQTQRDKTRERNDKRDKKMADKKDKYSNQYIPYECKRKFASKFDEYQYGEWKFNKPSVFVTPETEIPSAPKVLLEEPDDTEYHMAQVALDEEIEALNNTVTDTNKQFNDILAQLQDDPEAGRTARRELQNELQSQFKEQKIYMNKKNEIRKTLEVFEKQILEIERKILFKMKTVHPVYNKLALIEKGVSELQKRMSTSTLDRLTERQLVAEIEKIKKSRPALQDIEDQRKQILNLRKEKNKAAEGFPENDAIMKCIKEEINALKERQGIMDDHQIVLQQKLDTIKEQRTSMKAKFAKCRTNKAQLKEEHYDQLIKFAKQDQLIHDIEWLTQTKVTAVERAESKKKFDTERQERNEHRRKIMEERKARQDAIEAREKERKEKFEEARKEVLEIKLRNLTERNPYSEDIAQARQLLNFCDKHKLPVEEDATTDNVVNGNEAENGREEERTKRLDDAVTKNKLIQGEYKKDREDKEFIYAQGASKQQGKRTNKKPAKPEDSDPDPSLNLDLNMIMKFGRLGFSPPVKRSELASCAEQIKDVLEALLLLGKIEQAEGKSRLTGDKSYIENEEYLALAKRHKDQNEETLKRLQQIKEEKKKNWAQMDDDEDEDEDGVEIGTPTVDRKQTDNTRDRRPRRDFEDRRGGGTYRGGNARGNNRGGRGGRGGRQEGGQNQGEKGQGQPQGNNQRVRFDQIRNDANNFPTFE